MFHSTKRATVGTTATQNEPTSKNFEKPCTASTKIRAAFETKLENFDTCHAKPNKFISGNNSSFKDIAYRYPTKNKTGHHFHIIAGSVFCSLRSWAVLYRDQNAKVLIELKWCVSLSSD